jgi:glycerate kinase
MAEPAMRLLLAPNAFKGTFSAVRVAEIWDEALRGRPGVETLARPLSDGGDGALEVWESLLEGAMRVWFVARGPLGEARRTPVLWRGAGRAGFVESALACGLALLAPGARDPLSATTFGCGQLLLGLLEMGAREVTIGLGGSATCDGGLGLARALGYRFLAEGGEEIETPADLPRLARILPPQARPWEGARVRALWDVHSPLLGPGGAARVFAPQKFPPGAPAGAAEIRRLERGLERLAERAAADLGADLRSAPGTGAAGGLGAGLAAFAGASLESGSSYFLRLAGIPELVSRGSAGRVDGVLTGEGSFDAQSGVGKLAGELRGLCEAAGVPLVIVAGRAPAGADAWVLTGASIGAGSGALGERDLGALAVEAAQRIARAANE